ncbi:hypothetical protein [Hydrogenivirga sp.]
MGIRELMEVMRTEALNRLREESRKRKEHMKVRLLIPQGRRNREGRLERERRLL